MPLIDLKTNLKDLKYGHDQQNGANSTQPFVAVKIPATEDPLTPNYFPTGIFSGLDVNGYDLRKDKYVTTALLTGGALIGAGLGVGGALAAGAAGSALSAAGIGALVGVAGAAGGLIYNGSISGGSINFTYPEMPTTSGTGYTDFLIRGGTLLPTTIIKDATRMSRFLTSQNGLFFILKQQMLSMTSVRPQYAGPGFTLGLFNEGVFNPLSTVLGAVGAPFGLHVNKQDLNPILGLFRESTPDRYYQYITENNDIIDNDDKEMTKNRLYSLYNIKFLKGNYDKNARRNDVASDPNFILNYGGGPNSILGVGRTRIPYATDQYNRKLTVDKNNINGYRIQDLNTLSNGTHEDNSKFIATAIYTHYRYLGEYQGRETKYLAGDPGNAFLKRAGVFNFSQGYDYEKKEKSISYGAASPNSYDRITALPLYRTNAQDGYKPNDFPDLVNFRIGVINNSSMDGTDIDYIHFRAFLNTINDSFESSWNTVKYVGRGENFYTYSGFDRKVSLSWTVAAQSKIELIPMYKKLNYLASLTAPDYGASGYMRANIIQLTIGGYFFEQPGIINRISYEISEESTWEISRDEFQNIDNTVKQLPHMIKVQFDFTPIHNFVPRKQTNTYVEDKDDTFGQIETYGEQHFIALDYNNTSSYNDITQDKLLYKNPKTVDTPPINNGNGGGTGGGGSVGGVTSNPNSDDAISSAPAKVINDLNSQPQQNNGEIGPAPFVNDFTITSNEDGSYNYPSSNPFIMDPNTEILLNERAVNDPGMLSNPEQSELKNTTIQD